MFIVHLLMGFTRCNSLLLKVQNISASQFIGHFYEPSSQVCPILGEAIKEAVKHLSI